MSCYVRPSRPGATVFFTVALAGRGDDLLLREVARLRLAVCKTRAERPFEVLAWVTLPDHLHAVWRLPEGDADFATRWRLIKGRFAHGLPTQDRGASKARAGEKGIWQRRYWEHHIRGADDLALHIGYCRLDPVRHGFVERPETWPYAFVRRDLALLGAPSTQGAGRRVTFGE